MYFGRVIQRHGHAGIAQTWHEYALGAVCTISHAREGLPEQLRALSGSRCILYIVNPHSLHEGHGGNTHRTGDNRGDSQSLHYFLEEFVEVRLSRLRKLLSVSL